MSNERTPVVTVESVGRVGLITLNRPEHLNAWNGPLARALDAALEQVANDDRVGAVVVTGAGRAFCAGADLAGGDETFRNGAATDSPDDDNTNARTPGVLPWQVPKPVIAAINGHAVGVGATWALGCDIRIIAETAKIGFVFSRRGMLPELGAHAVLPQVVGFSHAADLLYSGRPISGIEAAAIGLASRALPTDQVLDHALSRADEMARLSAPASMAISKRLLWERLGVEPMRRREDPLFAWVAEQDDAVEGVASFLDKRDPVWSSSATALPEDLLA